MYVIGTSGHVDHGKTTLIDALTGINPDRLKEEQERKMTIDLGFAWLTLPDGNDVGIVDVPGHEDFIGNMLAGIGGIDAVLLIIAADEGVMPQTLEHLAILNLLEINKGIVVLTKIDLVEDLEWLELMEREIRGVIQNTSLRDAPIVRVSSQTRDGFSELLQTLTTVLRDCSPRIDVDRPRLPIDRAFSIAGFGTVVTGTLLDGHFNLGEEVEVLPWGWRGRIRGLQNHKRMADTVTPGSRTAVNLSGINIDKIHRGDVVTQPGQYNSTMRLDVYCHVLESISHPLTHHAEVMLYIGTSDTIANIRILGSDVIHAGNDGWLQLDLHKPIVAIRGERFILRRPSPSETIGGGVVVNPNPSTRHRRFDKEILDQLEILKNGSSAEILFHTIQYKGPTKLDDLFRHSQVEKEVFQSVIKKLVSINKVIVLGNFIMAVESYGKITDQIKVHLSNYHLANPYVSGIPREELKTKLNLSQNIFNGIITKLSGDGIIEETTSFIKLPEHKIIIPHDQIRSVERLMAKFDTDPYNPPSITECQNEIGKDAFNALLAQHELIPVSSLIVFRKKDYEEMVKLLIAKIQGQGIISLAEVRDLFKSSRRCIQPFLEHLDAEGITVRDGDFRKLNKR